MHFAQCPAAKPETLVNGEHPPPWVTGLSRASHLYPTAASNAGNFAAIGLHPLSEIIA